MLGGSSKSVFRVSSGSSGSSGLEFLLVSSLIAGASVQSFLNIAQGLGVPLSLGFSNGSDSSVAM